MTRRAITALLLAGCLGTSLVACGSDDDGTSGDTSTTVSGPQRAAKDVNVQDPTNLKEKPSVAVPDGKPPKKLEQVDLVEGTGPAAKTGDTVKVKYVGLGWSTGQEFDASWDRGDTLDVELGAGSVIPGWDQGIVGMKKGGRRLLVIPPNLAYGEQGQPPTIGANETLVFVVDAVSVTPKKS
jgi:peptidylprolyl isomerase